MSPTIREITIVLKPLTTDFAEDKDAAASIRDEQVRPALAAGHRIILDFNGVRVATQSFIHALISDVLRRAGESVLDRITFKRCSKAVRGIVETVVQYSLESQSPIAARAREAPYRAPSGGSAKKRKK